MKVSIFNELVDKLKEIIDNTPGAVKQLITEFDALNTVGSCVNRCNVKEIKDYDYRSYNTLYDLLCNNNEMHSNLVLNPVFIKYGSSGFEAMIPTNMRIYDVVVIEFHPYNYGVYSFKKKYCHSQSEKDYEELLEDMKESILFICSEPVSEDENDRRSGFNILCINNIKHEVFKEEHALAKLAEAAPELANETGAAIVTTIFSKKFPGEIKDHEFFTEINVMKGTYDSSNLTDKEMKSEFIPSDLSTAYEYGFFAVRSGALSYFNFHADTEIAESLHVEDRRTEYTNLVRNTFQNIEIDTIVFYELVPEVADVITNSVLNITVMRNTCEEAKNLYGKTYIGEEIKRFMNEDKHLPNVNPVTLADILSVMFFGDMPGLFMTDNGPEMTQREFFSKYSINKKAYSDQCYKHSKTLEQAFGSSSDYEYGYIALQGDNVVNYGFYDTRIKSLVRKRIEETSFLATMDIAFLDEGNDIIITFSKYRYIDEEGNDKAGLNIVINYNDRSVAVVKKEIKGHISEDDICRCLVDSRVPDYMIDRIMHNKTIRNANIPFDKITDISVTKPNFDLGGNLIIWEDCFKYKVLGFTVFDNNTDVILSYDKNLDSLGDTKQYTVISVFTILNIILSDNPNKNTAVLYGITELPSGTYKLRVSPITMDKKED